MSSKIDNYLILLWSVVLPNKKFNIPLIVNILTHTIPHQVFGYIAGPSGVGKGYGVGDILKEYCGARIFVTGDWCRANEEAHASSGVLVNDNIICQAIENDFMHHSDGHYLVDAPRSLEQFFRLEGMFKKINSHARRTTLHIYGERELCEELIRDRAIRQNRPDDAKPEVIKRRMDAYFLDGIGIRDTVIPDLKQYTTYLPIRGNRNLEKVRKYVRNSVSSQIFVPATVESDLAESAA